MKVNKHSYKGLGRCMVSAQIKLMLNRRQGGTKTKVFWLRVLYFFIFTESDMLMYDDYVLLQTKTTISQPTILNLEHTIPTTSSYIPKGNPVTKESTSAVASKTALPCNELTFGHKEIKNISLFRNDSVRRLSYTDSEKIRHIRHSSVNPGGCKWKNSHSLVRLNPYSKFYKSKIPQNNPNNITTKIANYIELKPIERTSLSVNIYF